MAIAKVGMGDPSNPEPIVMRRLATLFALVVGLAACRDESPTGTGILGILPVHGDTVVGTASVAELRLMRERWAATRDGRDYRFATFYSCFCPREAGTLVLVRVSGSRVAEVREVVTGTARPTERYYTIEDLFARAIAEREAGGRVRVTYALDAGHPVWIEIGTPENDGGVSYVIRAVALD